jgi:3-dehydroquinate synthase
MWPGRGCATYLGFDMATIRIESTRGPYKVVCARGAAARVRALVDRGSKPGEIFFVSSPRLWGHWGKKLAAKAGSRARLRAILFDDSEPAKRLATVEEIARALIRLGADRQATLVAVGGGVVGDVAGFAAATYLRGIRLVQVPTTLVAQVDSAIGGKTGVNLPEGKNLVGAFYPPELVVADPNLLSTLPHRQYRSGLYEVIKYAVITDRKLFDFLARHMLALLRRDSAALEYVIPCCIRIKAHIVEKDEREGGLRQILNFGHTLGHALETATGYKKFLHGEAVGYGMMFATLLALSARRLKSMDAAAILQMILSVGPLPRVPAIPGPVLRSLLLSDKKVRGGNVRWVLPSATGKVEWGLEVPWRTVEKHFRAFPALVDNWQQHGVMFGLARKR